VGKVELVLAKRRMAKLDYCCKLDTPQPGPRESDEPEISLIQDEENHDLTNVHSAFAVLRFGLREGRQNKLRSRFFVTAH
jgi:hypothetical protein